MRLTDMTAAQLGVAIREGTVTAVEAVEAVMAVIREREETLHCFVTLDEEGALRRAQEIQKKIESGALTGPLAGVPIAVKDNLCMQGMPTTCASKILEHFIPPYSSETVLRLQEAGAVILGKTNMDEFAMGSTTETSAFGPTANPWKEAHVPGGSSGGSAAAVASGECFMALGSDTGGSVRQPASYCGVVGMKPTYGTVSRYGLIAYGSSLDQIGPLCKDVTDCAMLLECIASYDEKDSTSMERKDTDFTSALVDDVKGLEIEKTGPAFENHERFPNRVNTEFVRVIDRKTVEMRVWERGSGETFACGTGACAVAVASILNGFTEDHVTVKLLGGDLEIEWDKEADRVYMTGPATVVYDGEITLPKL